MTVIPVEGPADRRVPLWMLALITLGGTLAMHIFVPALPQVAADLGASTAAAQLTLSAYIVGLAAAQLAYGPVSDRVGRRAPLVFGMVVYAVASVAAMIAPTIDLLIAARFFQAFGGGAGLVLGRAIVRDNATGTEAARKLSTLNLMVMIGPGLAPMAGAALAAATGWRSIFAVLCMLGVANLALVLRMLPEGGDAGEPRREIGASYRRLLTSRAFLAYAVGGGCATTAIYGYIGAAPFIFTEQLHRPAHEVGVFLLFNVLGLWLGSLTASRVAGRYPTRRLMIGGSLVGCVAALAFLILTLTGELTVAGVVIATLLVSYGGGLTSPLALSEALGVNPAIAGSASGLYGFMQMSIGAVAAALSGIGGDPALAVALLLVTAGAVTQFCFWLAGPRR